MASDPVKDYKVKFKPLLKNHLSYTQRKEKLIVISKETRIGEKISTYR